MKRKVLKIVLILLAFMMICSNSIIFASSVQDVFTGNTGEVTGAVTATKTILGMILDVVRIIGMGIAIIMLTFIGIKFMVASPSERANIKEYSINFVIGAFILIGATGILTIVKNFAFTIES